MKLHFAYFFAFSFVLGCAGMKVVDPQKSKDQGTLQLDYSGGAVRLVGTVGCTMVAANGQRVYAREKTEDEARREVIAKCRDKTVVSFCESARVECEGE